MNIKKLPKNISAADLSKRKDKEKVLKSLKVGKKFKKISQNFDMRNCFDHCLLLNEAEFHLKEKMIKMCERDKGTAVILTQAIELID